MTKSPRRLELGEGFDTGVTPVLDSEITSDIDVQSNPRQEKMRRRLSKEFAIPETLNVSVGPDLVSGTRIVSGFLSAGFLIPDRFKIPYYDPKTKRGYQRPPQEARVNGLAGDLRKNEVDLPTAVLLNLRGGEAKKLLEQVDDGRAVLRVSDLLAGVSPLVFYVVDGQHRILALKKLIEEWPSEGWKSFGIPFVCMIGASEDEELRQFYVVNSNAKSVRTDLAFSLMRRRVENEDGFEEILTERGKRWVSDAQALVERMNDTSSLWRGRIRLPAMEKGSTTITSSSMVASMKPLFSSPFFSSLRTEEKRLDVLEAFWGGVAKVLSGAFAEPDKYTVQKGIGVTVLHAIMPEAIEAVRSRGEAVTDREAFATVLSRSLTELQGETDQSGVVSGEQFWATTPEGGAAGSFSSSSGRRLLISKLRQLLPEVDL